MHNRMQNHKVKLWMLFSHTTDERNELNELQITNHYYQLFTRTHLSGDNWAFPIAQTKFIKMNQLVECF